MDFKLEEVSLEELGISNEEILLRQLFGYHPFRKDSLTSAFYGTYKNREFSIEHQEIQKGSPLHGDVTYSHKYKVSIATEPNKDIFRDSIKIETGEHGWLIDELLKELYLHARTEHHVRVLKNILS